MTKEEIIQSSITEHDLKFPDKVKEKVQDVILDCMNEFVAEENNSFEDAIAALKTKIEASVSDKPGLVAIKEEIKKLEILFEAGSQADRDSVIQGNIAKHDFKFSDKVKDKVHTVINDCLDTYIGEEKQLLEGGMVTLTNFYKETLAKVEGAAPVSEAVVAAEVAVEKPVEENLVVKSAPEPSLDISVEETPGNVEADESNENDEMLAVLTTEVATLKKQLAAAAEAPKKDGGMDAKLMQLEIDDLKNKLAAAGGKSPVVPVAVPVADTVALDEEIASLKNQLAEKDDEILALKGHQESSVEENGVKEDANEMDVEASTTSKNIITLEDLLQKEKKAV